MTIHDNEEKYISILKKSVCDRISVDINNNTINLIIDTNLVKSHIEDRASSDFQVYYFKTIDNESLFLTSSDFSDILKNGMHFKGLTTIILTDLK